MVQLQRISEISKKLIRKFLVQEERQDFKGRSSEINLWEADCPSSTFGIAKLGKNHSHFKIYKYSLKCCSTQIMNTEKQPTEMLRDALGPNVSSILILEF